MAVRVERPDLTTVPVRPVLVTILIEVDSGVEHHHRKRREPGDGGPDQQPLGGRARTKGRLPAVVRVKHDIDAETVVGERLHSLFETPPESQIHLEPVDIGEGPIVFGQPVVQELHPVPPQVSGHRNEFGR